jgi:hypothetical protein
MAARKARVERSEPRAADQPPPCSLVTEPMRVQRAEDGAHAKA